MKTLNNDELNILRRYPQMLLRESRLLPMDLLRFYSDFGLTEKEAIHLLRIVSLCFQSGRMTLAMVCEEFALDEADAKALLQPFVVKHFFEYQQKEQMYTCEGLFYELFLHWVSDRRHGGEDPLHLLEEEADSRQGSAERNQIRAISRMYRRFEAELGRTLAPAENEKIRVWITDEGFAPELLEEALRRAVLQGKGTLAYIGSILRAWQKKGLLTLDAVAEKDEKPESAKPRKEKKTNASGKYNDIYRNA